MAEAIPKEIRGSKETPLNVAADPETTAAVNAFLQEKQAENPAPAETTPPEQKEPVAPNTNFDMPAPQDTMIQRALIDPRTVDVTEEEKRIFLRSLLHEEEPTRFVLKLCNGQFNVQVRARSIFEQRRVFEVLMLEEKNGVVPKDQVALAISRFQHHMAAIMVENINDRPFSSVKLDENEKVEESATKLNEFAQKQFDKMSGTKWNMILEAMRLFENKCARCTMEIDNPNFWVPLG